MVSRNQNLKLFDWCKRIGWKENIRWILLGIFILIPFCSFVYLDTKSILHFEVNFAEALLRGNIKNFYQFCYEKVQFYLQEGIAGNHYATYDFPLHAVLGIWGIPLYLVCNVNNIEVTSSMLGILYGKSIFLLAMIGVSVLIYKICLNLEIPPKKAKSCAFLFCSSTLIISSICIIGQSDIIGIFFILQGMNSYIKKENNRFVFWFMIAVPFKMYALFIFIPLLLLHEKRVIYIGIKGIIVVALTVISNWIFNDGSPAIEEKAKFSNHMLEKIFENKINLMNGEIPILLILFFGICVWCYLHEKDKDFYECAVFVPLITVTAIFISFNSYPYWFLYLTPFIAIAITYNEKYFDSVLLFETIGMTALTLGHYIQYFFCFEIINGHKMLICKLMNGEKGSKAIFLENLIQDLPDVSLGVLYAVYIVCMISIVFLCNPKFLKRRREGVAQEVDKKLNIRMLVNICVGYIPVFLLIYNYL